MPALFRPGEWQIVRTQPSAFRGLYDIHGVLCVLVSFGGYVEGSRSAETGARVMKVVANEFKSIQIAESEPPPYRLRVKKAVRLANDELAPGLKDTRHLTKDREGMNQVVDRDHAGDHVKGLVWKGQNRFFV